MNPHQKNKVDVKSLSPEEQRLFRLYGKLPSRSDHFAKHLKDRKYFDSGDYAMSKAGKGDGVDAGAVGSQHPVPENIPHLSSPNGSSAGTKHVHPSIPGIQAGSPIKESSFLKSETSADETQQDGNQDADKPKDLAGPPAPIGEPIPIRR
ncbi:camp-regulated phosphoprotein/endosulfine conserved region-domain-containing protein [Dactylonectria macrodidyma]|uniref:mRNA stability protein n=1 Tax=Dactylonectria macrodidyma TaxID=307937 RepID=A0A9P9J808_9HYPO|nr:camp-regulated phosphoprotein/endosulfine conserved region-domain-containing protein [Dactylonectria macrodidyma]